MSEDEANKLKIDLHMKEYQALKDEQLKRIVARDHIIYLTIGAVGYALSQSTGANGSPNSLLIVPWVCLLMGWLHIINDQKVIDIAKYYKNTLEPELRKLLAAPGNELLVWETRERAKDSGHRLMHFIIKLSAFFLPGIGSAGWFIYHHCAASPFLAAVAWLSLMLLLLEVGYLDRYFSVRNIGGNNERNP